MREELNKLRRTQTCPACQGARLRLEARHVRIGDDPIPSHAGCKHHAGIASISTTAISADSTAPSAAASSAPQGQAKGLAIYEVEALALSDCLQWFKNLSLTGAKKEIADRIVHEIQLRLEFLNNVGLNYLSLDRSADTISGGEAQRIRLASQIGSGLTGVMYVLDEPSIGLHQRDNDKLIQTL